MGRPSKALLDRARIGATALALVDESGDFSVPQIARRLGVQTASVYHHVDGRAGIVELLRVQVSAAIDLDTLDLRPWDVALEAWARSYRAAFAAHPRTVLLLTTSQVAAPEVLDQYERAVALLLESGFPPPVAMPLLTAVENLVLGSVLDLAAPETVWDPTADTPRLAEALRAAGPGRSEAAFDLALTALLTRAHTLLP
ncbi:tetracycline repressor, C-all-alpha domain protein [Kitasatospora phosalacinea]|uniref:Tetracycline repressor, C-all-alpha domain protein n=1 Tax=Kitasatospora phosalacinea TaxID=2065 RepID=A0A9W6QCI7_9ACTN|nr:TetR/AcrR family transcriptional regulator C-terminal domain-containing protein [Kitasatospora phosalacinea]GLW72508.1 tetracycline repressor, C-all-alpha domain protein [Kitasatospora phosalacinea]